MIFLGCLLARDISSNLILPTVSYIVLVIRVDLYVITYMCVATPFNVQACFNVDILYSLDASRVLLHKR